MNHQHIVANLLTTHELVHVDNMRESLQCLIIQNKEEWEKMSGFVKQLMSDLAQRVALTIHKHGTPVLGLFPISVVQLRPDARIIPRHADILTCVCWIPTAAAHHHGITYNISSNPLNSDQNVTVTLHTLGSVLATLLLPLDGTCEPLETPINMVGIPPDQHLYITIEKHYQINDEDMKTYVYPRVQVLGVCVPQTQRRVLKGETSNL